MSKPIELEEAIELLMKHQPKQKTSRCSLEEALHHRLAKDLYAPIDVPMFNRSAMDGYAVCASLTKGAVNDRPIVLKVAKEILAGISEREVIDHQYAVRIMTGAPIPDGFDAVIRQEDTNQGEEWVEIHTEVATDTNYGKRGEDIQKGDLLIKKGTMLTPIHLGIIASVGLNEVEVLKPLSIGFISVGSELALAGEALQYGQIYNSNLTILVSRLKELNVQVAFTYQLPDEFEVISTVIKEQIDEVDLLLTTGAVSVGKKDVMHDVIDELGAKRLFWRMNIQPGTPMLATTYQEKLILSLSGNPFAALTTFELVVKPICGIDSVQKEGTLMTDFPKRSKRRRFVRGCYKDGQVFIPTSKHASSVLSSLLGCNCLIDVPEGSPPLEKGTRVQVVML